MSKLDTLRTKGIYLLIAIIVIGVLLGGMQVFTLALGFIIYRVIGSMILTIVGYYMLTLFTSLQWKWKTFISAWLILFVLSLANMII